MSASLQVSAAQHSSAGVKERNEDACGIHIPRGIELENKGIAAVIADGMSGSDAGKEAAEACVSGFLADYFTTPESWSTGTAGGKVLAALNRWLYAQCREQDGGSGKGMVTTLSALVIKSATAHLFHVGDTRIWRMRRGRLECLTRDHRVRVAADKNYLSRAMGIELHMEIDYRALPVEAGDVYLLTTDGVHDFVPAARLAEFLYDGKAQLEDNAARITACALDNGSHDNVTCQLVRVAALPDLKAHEFYRRYAALPFPPPLEPGMVLDGYEVIRELHASKRTQVYLARDRDSQRRVILKTPSVNYSDDPEYIDAFLHEEWAGRRIRSQHVLKVLKPHVQHQCLYYVTEYIEGQTLRQWMHDNPQPALETVRGIAGQIAAGLRAFHRQEMIHQDLKPENIMIDAHGTVKIIDFGSTKIAGIAEIASPLARDNLLGTRNYTAPEYLQGYPGSNLSDLYSLGVITYELLTGRLPYGEKALTARRLRRARYVPAAALNPDIPVWVDRAIEKAVALERARRYPALSEFLHDLAHPGSELVPREFEPLIERNPLLLWKGLALALLLLDLLLLYLLAAD